MEKIGRVVTAALVGLVIGLAIGWFKGNSDGKRDMVVEAVKQNHGHYKIVDDLGRTQFEWGAVPVPPK